MSTVTVETVQLCSRCGLWKKHHPEHEHEGQSFWVDMALTVANHFDPDTDPCPGQIIVNYDEYLALQREVKQLREINHIYLMEGKRRER